MRLVMKLALKLAMQFPSPSGKLQAVILLLWAQSLWAQDWALEAKFSSAMRLAMWLALQLASPSGQGSWAVMLGQVKS